MSAKKRSHSAIAASSDSSFVTSLSIRKAYSSLSYLRRFPVDTLKIDQSFVRTMDAENYAIVKTIVGLARNLDLKVVAEGVETIDQRQLLALAGCGSAQGHLFAEPMPAQRVGAFIESNRRNSEQTKQIGLARSTAGL